MFNRALVIVALLVAGAGVLARAERIEDVPIRESLAFLPMQIDDWRGVKAPDFEKQILDVLGVDDYVTRVYYRSGTPGSGSTSATTRASARATPCTRR